MKWDDFAVQIEDPQDGQFRLPPVFQLGFVNLPSAEIPGVEAEFAFRSTSPGRSTVRSPRTMLMFPQATILDARPTADDNVYEIPVTDNARLPLTPDWSATLGIEFRARGRLLNAQPFARFDYAYVGDAVNNLEGIESVVSTSGVQDLDSYHTGDLRFGLEGEHWSGSIFIDNVWDERANRVPEQPLGGAAAVDQPAAHLRAAVPLRLLIPH